MPLDPSHSTSATATQYIPGAGISKPVSQYTLVGTQVRRIDIPAKVNGTYTYIQNVRVPGMVHARSVRPRGAGANTSREPPADQRRRELDRAHPGRSGRPDQQLARRLAAPQGVRRDPGRVAAEGGLEERPEVHPVAATTGRGCARPATRTSSTRPATRPTPAAFRRRSQGRRRPSRRRTATTTTTSSRSARTARSPTSRARQARPCTSRGRRSPAPVATKAARSSSRRCSASRRRTSA